MIEIGRRPLTCADVDAVASGRTGVVWPDRPADLEAPPRGPPSRWILAHCVGVGPPLPPVEVRAIVVTRAARKATPFAIHALLHMLDPGPLPVVPSRGDHGTPPSSTLAHIARHMALLDDDAARAFVNDSASCTAAFSALAVMRAARIASAFHQAHLMTAHAPWAHGASSARARAVLHATFSAVDHARGATDHLLSDDDLVREPLVAAAMDALRTALIQCATASERRVFRMTNGSLSGLPSFLVPTSGIHSGLMLAQYTAASLVSEMRTMSAPASADTIPTFAHEQDWTPRGPAAARTALAACDLAADVAAIELLCAAQAWDLSGRAPDGNAAPIRDLVRTFVAYRDTDRALHPDIAALGAAVSDGAFRMRAARGPAAPRSARP